jgi:hypothetical protein
METVVWETEEAPPERMAQISSEFLVEPFNASY